MIRAKKVYYFYQDGTKALDGLSIHIQENETTLIAGPNGSGKSTLAQHLNALLLPSKGEILVQGTPTENHETSVRQKVGLVFQNPDDQIVCNSVRDDIAFGPRNLGLSSSEVKSRVNKVLDIMNISKLANRSPHLLSEGQKKKVAIAGVLAMKPDCIVLDDPLAGLDFPSISSLVQNLVSLKKNDLTIVLFSHRIEYLWQIADQIFIMNDGQIVENGPPSKFFGKNIIQYGIDKPFAWKSLETLLGKKDIQDLLFGK